MERPRPGTIDYKQVTIKRIRRRIIIPFMKGRPVRETIIQTDDITNLIIFLNTCKTVSEFIAKV